VPLAWRPGASGTRFDVLASGSPPQFPGAKAVLEARKTHTGDEGAGAKCPTGL